MKHVVDRQTDRQTDRRAKAERGGDKLMLGLVLFPCPLYAITGWCLGAGVILPSLLQSKIAQCTEMRCLRLSCFIL